MTWLKRVVECGPPWETRAARDLGQEKSWVRSGEDPVTTSGLGSGDPEGITISWCGNRIALHFVQEVLRAFWISSLRGDRDWRVHQISGIGAGYPSPMPESPSKGV